MRRLAAFVILLVLGLCSSPAIAEKSPIIKLDSMQLGTNSPSLIVNNRVLVPLRSLSEAQGAKVIWNGKTQSITVTRGSDEITLKLGSNVANHNGKSIIIESAPTTFNGTTYVPLRFAAEGLGAKVTWDVRSGTVNIKDNKISKLLNKLSQFGKSSYWKIADINKDGKPEMVALVFTAKGRQFVVFNENKQLFSKFITGQVNQLSLIDLDNKTMGIAVYQSSSTRIKNAIIYKVLPEITELGKFAFSRGTIQFRDYDGKTLIIDNSGTSKTYWEFNGTKLAPVAPPKNKPGISNNGTGTGGVGETRGIGGTEATAGSGGTTGTEATGDTGDRGGTGDTEATGDTGASGDTAGTGSSGNTDLVGTYPGTPPGPINTSNINSVSQTVFYQLLSGNLESTKALTLNPGDPQTEAYLRRCASDIENFINKHNGTPWTTSTGTVANGNTTQYFNWIKYPEDSGYLVVNLQKANDKWLISKAEFKIGD